MRLPPILEILWARRLIVLTATLSSLVGGLVVMWTSVPRYEAGARVILDYIKPDPVTGATVPNKMVAAYVNSQLQFIRDYQVAIPAAESLGMMDSIDLADAYAALPGKKPEYRQWVAQRIMYAVNAVPIEDSSIIEIRYRAPDPRVAQDVVEAVRTAYVDASIEQRRQSSMASADTLLTRAEEVKSKLRAKQEEQSKVERASGIMLQAGRRDIDSSKLRSLSLSNGPSHIQTPAVTNTAARLAVLEADAAAAAKSLGPNNPQVQMVTAERVRLKALQAAEGSTATQAAQAVVARDRLAAQMLEAQKTKVLNQRLTTMELRLLQDEVDGYTEQINSLTSSAVAFRQMATAKETSLTPIGAAVAKPKPVFPNPTLILGGTAVLGILTGAMLAWFAELQARRVRSMSDLEHACGAPVLGTMPLAAVQPRRWGFRKRPPKVKAPRVRREPRRPRGKLAA